MWIRKSPLPGLSLLLLIPLALACSSTPPPADPISYQVRVKNADTNEYVQDATVSIEVTGTPSPSAVTDSRGIAIVPLNPKHIKQTGLLIIEANGYARYTQHIEIVEAPPKNIRLEPLAISVPTQPSAPNNQADAFAPPTATENVNTPAPTTASTTQLTGYLAIPLMLGLTPKIYIADTQGNLLGSLDSARQPDYTLDGTKLIVNGDGGGLDKLRIADATGQTWHEMGDPTLAGQSHPTWSPDGSQVIYDDGTIDPFGWHMFKCGCDHTQGEGERLDAAIGTIINPNPLYPLWTSNNRYIFKACNTWANQASSCGLWMMQENKGAPEQLTYNPVHVPTDVYQDTVMYVSDEAGNRNIYTLNLMSKKSQQLTFHPASDGLATISPNGQTVAFLSNRDGVLAVWYASINGGSIRKMFNIPTQWGGLHKDGWTEEKLSWGKNS